MFVYNYRNKWKNWINHIIRRLRKIIIPVRTGQKIINRNLIIKRKNLAEEFYSTDLVFS